MDGRAAVATSPHIDGEGGMERGLDEGNTLLHLRWTRDGE
jgi:hypothetical protein